VSELLKFRQFQGGFALTPDQGLCPGVLKPPDPQYRLALRARLECCPPTFQTMDSLCMASPLDLTGGLSYNLQTSF
jgi:hypothetical protein